MRQTALVVLCIVCCLLASSQVQGQVVWHVYEDGSGDAPDITTAVLWATNGDTIIVHAGTYYESQITINETLTIIGIDGPEVTAVDMANLTRCLYLPDNSNTVRIEGLTMRNGYTAGHGGGIYCTNSNVTLTNCVILDCSGYNGGGIHIWGADPILQDCTVHNCASDYLGGGIYSYNSTPTLTGCLISDNDGNDDGGGIYLYGASSAVLSYCTIVWNDTDYGSGAGVCLDNSSAVIDNCTISHNILVHTSMHGGGIFIGPNSSATITNTIVSFSWVGEGIYGDATAIGATISCCNVFGNYWGEYGGTISDQTGLNGNFSLDPLFCNPFPEENYNYDLSDASPCQPGGNPCAVQVGAAPVGCTFGTWYVTDDGMGDAPTIQAAIEMAWARDTIVVATGTFTGTGNRDIQVGGKGVYIRSESGPEVTVINAESDIADGHAGFLFDYEWRIDTTTVVEGLTITGCSNGGIVFSYENDPIINECIITENNDLGIDHDGSGVRITGAGPRIHHCIISNNTTDDRGGGIYMLGGVDAHIYNCEITNNSAVVDGGGISQDCVCDFQKTLIIDHCTISNNSTAGPGGGLRYWCEAPDVLIVTYSLFTGNSSGTQGGGIYFDAGILILENCTIALNSAPTAGAGIYHTTGDIEIGTSIVAFNEVTEGIYSTMTSIPIYCSDVYGNAGGNYGGGLTDPTGTNDNISEDPLFCNIEGGNFHIFDISPCSPEHTPCGALMGALDEACEAAPELIVEDVTFSDFLTRCGEAITCTIQVRNVGLEGAGGFYIDYYMNPIAPPGAGDTGDLRHFVESLAVDGIVVWAAGPITTDCYGFWQSFVQVDTDESVPELVEDNNVSGPHTVIWQPPVQGGWPQPGGGEFRSSPAIARLDDDPSTQEVIVGCDDGFVYAFTQDGQDVPGWPVWVVGPVSSSPAVGNIMGDEHLEVVFGCEDGNLYAYDYTGTQLWSYLIGYPITTTPALADLDDDGTHEVILGARGGSGTGFLYVLNGDGSGYGYSWPINLGGTYATSAAVGDVDVNGSLEISVVAGGFEKPVHSKLYLFNDLGIPYSMNWPVDIDTVVVTAPVMGNLTSDEALEFVVGGMNGKVYAVNLAGAIWPSPPVVPGKIEQSLVLTEMDMDDYQEILLGSRFWHETSPPFGYWRGVTTAIDNLATIFPGWPNVTGSWGVDAPMPAPIAVENRTIIGEPAGLLTSWLVPEASLEGGFYELGCGPLSVSPAIGDLDGDGWLELVAPSMDGQVYCYDLECNDAFHASRAMHWPMFRNGRLRTGCYVEPSITGVEEPDEFVPDVTALHTIYPNPFNPVTRIVYDVARISHVNITVYDVLGNRVCVLKDAVVRPGRHEISWTGTTDSGMSVASGVYFCRLAVDGVVQTKKMVLLR